MSKTIIGIDLGGTNLRIGAVKDHFHIAEYQILNSRTITYASDPLQKLSEIIEDFIQTNQIADIAAVSIGVPSSVKNDRQTVVYTANLRDPYENVIFQNTNIAVYLEKKLSLPVLVSHDTDNILLYDIYQNDLKQEGIILGIYIGTGVGASVCIHEENLTGANGVALDIGHMPFFNSSVKCSCGKQGCCECHASGWALQKIRETYYPDTPIQKLFLKHQKETPLEEFVYACAHTFAVMATIFNPNTIVAGGGVIEMEGFPKSHFEKLVNENTGLDVMQFGFQYIYSRPLPEKGIIGAAIAAEKYRKLK